MRRLEEEIGRISSMPVLIESSINTVIGDFDIKNVQVYALYGNKVVTEVPAGATFEIHVEYDIENLNPGLGFAALWTTCTTVYDVTHKKAIDADSFGGHTGGGLKHAHDAVNVRMPSEYTYFRVKIFANQIAWGGAPPASEW